MMKTSVRTVILSAAAIFAAISCQKEESVPGTQDIVKAGETIQLSIDASLGDLIAADGTKATAKTVVRLTWGDDDTVDAYFGATKLNTEPITVTPSENKLSAKLSGTINASSLTSGTSVITFVYHSGCTTTDGLTFNFASQDDGIPFVAYATLKYDGAETLNNKMVGFKFATSVMKIAVTNLGGGTISNAAISGINTKVTLSPSENSETCGIAGSENAAITKPAGIDASSDGSRAIITVGLVPDNTSKPYRMLTVNQTGYTNKGVITSTEIKSNASYTTPASLFTCGTLGTGGSAHDYVLIAGTKWATRNIGATGDTGTDSYGTYFAWGDTEGQEALTKTGADDISNAFSPGFDNPGSYTENPKQLPLEKDAANVKWGDPWRMPTKDEFQALKDASYWKWDSEDGGYYVYAPQDGDAGKYNNGSEAADSYNKSAALLFFPAAGSGNGTTLSNAGSYGRYWSSSLYSSLSGAYSLFFSSSSVNPQNINGRSHGRSVRPVSD